MGQLCAKPAAMPEGAVEEWTAHHLRQWFEYKEFTYDRVLEKVDGKRLLGMTEKELGELLKSTHRARVIHNEFHMLAFRPDKMVGYGQGVGQG
ncbi:hypothetical protein FOA52_007311 [Chlamydomonas sp. UWO 241]|nr:hypothetical protein FOA52_007311 [Chlamydomonas sp. UWO 241]